MIDVKKRHSLLSSRSNSPRTRKEKIRSRPVCQSSSLEILINCEKPVVMKSQECVKV